MKIYSVSKPQAVMLCKLAWCRGWDKQGFLCTQVADRLLLQGQKILMKASKTYFRRKSRNLEGKRGRGAVWVNALSSLVLEWMPDFSCNKGKRMSQVKKRVATILNTWKTKHYFLKIRGKNIILQRHKIQNSYHEKEMGSEFAFCIYVLCNVCIIEIQCLIETV